MMTWTELVIEVTRSDADALCDALVTEGALSVSIEDANDGTHAEVPLFGEPGMEPEQHAWDHNRVIALFDTTKNISQCMVNVVTSLNWATLPNYTTRRVEEQDWVRITQAQFEPLHIGKHIWVVPSWHGAPTALEGVILKLDPGLAFGTGSHPTTRLCMEWLEQNIQASHTVLDYGCGSGILAMVAKKMGASSVWGVDIDPQAIHAAQYNATQNECDIHYALPKQFAQTNPAPFNIVIANILAGPLIEMAPQLIQYLAPSGTLVLSGILHTQTQTLIDAYAPYIHLRLHDQCQDWVLLSGQLI
jgi:ribosomal protein L11 methyltransferase